MEANAGYVTPMGRDPLPGYRAANVSALRPHGATTGAWPGFQPFGGWKGAGSSGKHGGGLYYLPLYMREQIRTLVEKRKGGPGA